MTEASWRKLIKQIREGQVVPVIGPRLLTGAVPGDADLASQVARQLLALHDPDADPAAAGVLTPGRELHEVVSRLKAHVDLQDLYSDVHDALAGLSAGAPATAPLAIRQLAAISDFRLLVTLTADDVLARCLRQRIAVNEVVHAPKWGSDDWADLPVDWATARRHEVQLLYLFGKASSLPTFAIHDEDLLEFSHNIIAGGSQLPRRFLDELRRKGLLLIGCDFPDWLSRFFLRVTNAERLSKKETRTWLVEPLAADASLTCFLRGFASQTEVLADWTPQAFVAELHRRWLAEQAAAATVGTAVAAAGGGAEPEVPRGALFFVSYSRRTDLNRAEALVAALRGLGVAEHEVWFDRRAIEPGQDYRQRIVDGIDGCRYFLPLLSDAANAREEAFVFSEWRAADQRRQNMNRDFVLPIIVDAGYQPERYTASPVRAWALDHLDFGHAPDGVPDARTQAALQKMVRSERSAAS